MVFRAGLPWLAVIVSLQAACAMGQTPASPSEKPTAPGLIKLTGEDEKRARQLDTQIDEALKADRWAEAIAKAEELLALRMRVQGPKHFETTTARWLLKTLRTVAAMPHDDRVAFLAAAAATEQAAAASSQGKYAKAQEIEEKALEARRRLLSEDHPDTAQSYNNLAVYLIYQGKYAKARPLLEKALEIRRRVLSDDHPDTTISYNSVAYNLDQQGKYGEAQQFYEKALEIRRRLLTDFHPDTARVYDNLASNLANQAKYTEAQRLAQKALEIRRKLLTDDHAETANSYNNVGMYLNAQGKYAEAQPLLEKAVEIKRRVLTDDHPLSAISYNNLAMNLADQGKFALAEPLYQKALDIKRRLLTDNHPSTASGYRNLAKILNDQGKYAAARPLFEKALEICRRLFSDEHPLVADAYNNLAFNLMAEDKFAEAEPLLAKALDLRRRLLGDDHPDTAQTYNNVAMNLALQGKYDQADGLLAKALQIRIRLHLDDGPEMVKLLNNLAGNFYDQGKYVEARDQWLIAVKKLDSARLRAAFSGTERALTGSSVRLALAAVQARLGEPREAWQALEQDLGRGLLDELAARRDQRLTPAERARLGALTGELGRLDALAESTPKNLDEAARAKRYDDLKHQRDLASIALGEFRTKLLHEHGEQVVHVATLEEIQAALPADAALIAWIDIAAQGPNAADPDGEHWGVVVRSRGIPAWVRIAGTGPAGHWTKDDKELASRVRTELRARPGAGAGTADLRPLIAKLRAQRLEPLAKALGSVGRGASDPALGGLPPARRLIVLPSRGLARIPVEALLAADDSRAVSYAPSATVYKYLCEQPRPEQSAGLLALGEPVYGRPDQSSDEAFTPLPGTRREVKAIARLFQSEDRQTLTLLASDASEPELDRLAASGALGRFGFIHLATHALIDEAVPPRSAVILTQTGLPDPLEQALNHKPVFDGRLSVSEIQRTWDLKAELVTLSACETALGREAGGEGFVGFTQALLISGARSVCLSLWNVDDKATSLLMTRFYQNMLGKRAGLSKPLPKARALQEAKEWLRALTANQVDGELAALDRGGVRPLAKDKNVAPPKEAPSSKSSSTKPYEHPYFWAAFVLVGDRD